METNEAYKSYLDYLDKEMNIMGVLSAFCATASVLGISSFGNTKEDTLIRSLFNSGWHYPLAAVISMLLAAMFFYRQRSLLAWYHGQIALSLVNPEINEDNFKESKIPTDVPVSEKWLREADSWSTWINYRIAFICVGAALAECAFAIFNYRFNFGVVANSFFHSLIILLAMSLSLIFRHFFKKNAFEESWFPTKQKSVANEDNSDLGNDESGGARS